MNIKNRDEIKIIPLGGLGEVGKNIMYIEYKDEGLLVDAGFKFPDYDMQGVDYVIPNFDFIKQVKNKIKGIVLTHGHMDHIGALSYLLEVVDVPLYGTKLTLGLVDNVIPGRLKPYKENIIKAGDKILISKFDLEFIRVTHSIPDSVAIAIRTSEGIILHTGDFKIDQTPIDNNPIDLHKLSDLGKEGVLLLMSDSTNAEESGFANSEKSLRDMFEQIIRDAPARVIFSTFSTNIHRIHQVIDAGIKYSRRVFLDGRSIVETIKVAKKIKALQFPESVFLDSKEVSTFPKNRVVIITTGTQGEPMSGLSRLARGEHELLKVEKNDRVIISADPIPGNEDIIARTIDNLFRREAFVFYRKEDKVHVSGHGAVEDLKLMINLTKPKFFMPIHGEYRQLIFHKRIAEEMGIHQSKIIITENGSGFVINAQKYTRIKKVPAEGILIDGSALGEADSPVLTDRKRLAKEGILTVIISIDRVSGKFLAGPLIITKGVFPEKSEIISELKKEIKEFTSSYKKERDLEIFGLKEGLVKFIKDYVRNKTKRYPMIVPVILEH